VPPPGLVVLFGDNHLIAIDKPAGLLCQGAVAGDDNALERVREYIRVTGEKTGNVYTGLVHRLDRNTSGVVLFARTSKAASRLSDLFARRGEGRAEKRYLAVVVGQTPSAGRLEHHLVEQDHGVRVAPGGKEALLEFETLASSAAASLVRVSLLTGRKHQIRAQFSAAGHPLVGDRRYGDAAALAFGFARPALHAASLRLEHPVRHSELLMVSPLPTDIVSLCARLGLAVPETPQEN